MVNHLFLHCDCSFCLWIHLFNMHGLCCSLLGELVEAWRLAPLQGRGSLPCKVALLAVLRSIWKKMNDYIIRGAMLCMEEVLSKIFLRLAKSVIYMKDYNDFKLDKLFFN